MSIEERFSHVGGLQPAVGSDFNPFSSDEIVKIETIYDCTLPDQLRELLTEFGGVRCGEYVGFDPVEALPATLSTSGKGGFSHFFVNDNSEYDETNKLSYNIEVYRSRTPDELMPIGTDGGGGLICMGHSGDYEGKIYYWDYTNEWDEDDYLDVGEPVPDDLKFQNIHLISDSLEGFLKRLFVNG